MAAGEAFVFPQEYPGYKFQPIGCEPRIKQAIPSHAWRVDGRFYKLDQGLKRPAGPTSFFRQSRVVPSMFM